MTIGDNTALILEGGGLRGVFTCGVLDCFMDKGIRKNEKQLPVPKFIYRKYPELRKTLSSRNAEYNRMMEMIERLEDEGRMTVIRPVHPIEVDRMEKDTDKLRSLYQEGYELAESFLATL